MTGEELFDMHARNCYERRVQACSESDVDYHKGGSNIYWYQLSDPAKQAWEATARQLTHQAK